MFLLRVLLAAFFVSGCTQPTLQAQEKQSTSSLRSPGSQNPGPQQFAGIGDCPALRVFAQRGNPFRQGNHTQALHEIDTAEKLDPSSYSIHYLRGQVFRSLKRAAEAQAEMRIYTQMSNDAQEKRHQELEAGPTPNPEVAGEPK